MVAHAHVRSFRAAVKAVSIKGAQGLLLVSVLLTALSPMPVAAKRSVMATAPAQSVPKRMARRAWPTNRRVLSIPSQSGARGRGKG